MHALVTGLVRHVPLFPQNLGEALRKRMNDYARQYLGMTMDETVERFPSFLTGSMKQGAACFRPVASFARNNGPALMLVPGLFCMPSIFNDVGSRLEAAGVDVYLPRPFPPGFGVLANTARVDSAVEVLLQDLEGMYEDGIESVYLAGHSLGGIITLRALERAEFEGRRIPRAEKVIVISSPLGGAPLAGLLASIIPACRDIAPGSDFLKEIAPTMKRITHMVFSDFDFLVPGVVPRTETAEMILMKRFQHMDFYVGDSDKLDIAAETLLSLLPVQKDLKKDPGTEES